MVTNEPRLDTMTTTEVPDWYDRVRSSRMEYVSHEQMRYVTMWYDLVTMFTIKI